MNDGSFVIDAGDERAARTCSIRGTSRRNSGPETCLTCPSTWAITRLSPPALDQGHNTLEIGPRDLPDVPLDVGAERTSGRDDAGPAEVDRDDDGAFLSLNASIDASLARGPTRAMIERWGPGRR